MSQYGYHLKDSIRKMVKLEPEGIKISDLTNKLNGYLQLNHAPKTRDYRLLRHRITQACHVLKTDQFIEMESKVEPEFKTTYYIVKPTEKC